MLSSNVQVVQLVGKGCISCAEVLPTARKPNLRRNTGCNGKQIANPISLLAVQSSTGH